MTMDILPSEETKERKIYGVVAIILSFDGKILVVEETENRPEYDKKAGDISNPTETIEEGETELEALERLLEEEVGVREGMICDPDEDWIGDYQIGGTDIWGRAYLVHYQGRSDSSQIFKAEDGEVINHRWIEPSEIGKMPRRAGVLEVVKDFLHGHRGVIRHECLPGFRPD